MEESSKNLRIIAASSMLLTAIIGFALNLTITTSLFTRFKLNSGFLNICMVKSISNNIICVGFLLWPVPIVYLNAYFLPPFYNVLAGQIIGWFAWIYIPTTQILLAGNRLVAVYFPQEYHANYKFPPNKIFLSIIFVLSCLIAIPGFIEGCHFLFILETLSWEPQSSPCSLHLSIFFTHAAFTMSFISNAFNIVVFCKLVSDAKLAKISSVEFHNRQRRRRRMLFQNCCQDLIIAIDTFNTTYAWKFYTATWFLFLVCCYSMVLARTLEALVMVTINETIRGAIRDKFFRTPSSKRSSFTQAPSMVTHSKNIVASIRLSTTRLND